MAGTINSFSYGEIVLSMQNIFTVSAMQHGFHAKPLQAICELPSISVSKQVFVPFFIQNHSYENKFDLYENKPVGETHLHKNGFVLTQRQNKTWKWPITETNTHLTQTCKTS